MNKIKVGSILQSRYLNTKWLVIDKKEDQLIVKLLMLPTGDLPLNKDLQKTTHLNTFLRNNFYFLNGPEAETVKILYDR